MKKTLLFLLILTISAYKTDEQNDYQMRIPTLAISKIKVPKAEGEKRILFVGYSNTESYVHLHELFKALCDGNNKNFEIETINELRVSLSEIYDKKNVDTTSVYLKNDVDGNYFDYVVLQEKIPVESESFDDYKAKVKDLMDAIYKNSPGVVVLINESITPLDYRNERIDFKNIYGIIESNALNEVNEIPNSRILKIGSAIKDAYDGEYDYDAYRGNDDLLRHGVQNLNLSNDAGFLASVVLYETVFGTEPKIPALLPFSTGFEEDDKISLQLVNKVISNKSALMKIAYANK